MLDLYAEDVRRADKTDLITANLPFVIHIAKRYWRPGLDLMDLIGEGNLGLLRAVETFDENKGKFTTYAAFWIKFYVRVAIYGHDLIRIPRAHYVKNGRLNREIVKKSMKLRCRKALKDMPFEEKPILEVNLGVLSRQERKCIELRYYRGLKRKEVARRMNVHENTVRTIQKRALRKLYQYLGENW